MYIFLTKSNVRYNISVNTKPYCHGHNRPFSHQNASLSRPIYLSTFLHLLCWLVLEKPNSKMEGDAAASGDFDMQVIGNFLSFASRGDRVGLNQMLREGTSPNVQDYDKRTALHLAASEGHAPIVELLLQYKANLNLKDRWQRTVS